MNEQMRKEVKEMVRRETLNVILDIFKCLFIVGVDLIIAYCFWAVGGFVAGIAVLPVIILATLAMVSDFWQGDETRG